MNRNAIVLVIVVIVVSAMIYSGAYRSRSPEVVAATDGKLEGGSFIGKQAPDFELETLDGKKVRLSDYRGKAILLNFWATWCGPCKIEMPWLIQFQQQYKDQGLVILGVAMEDTSKEDIASYAKDAGVNYSVMKGKEFIGELYGGLPGLPTTFYIDRNGKILAQHVGLNSRSDIEDRIKEALASTASAPAAVPGTAAQTPAAQPKAMDKEEPKK